MKLNVAHLNFTRIRYMTDLRIRWQTRDFGGTIWGILQNLIHQPRRVAEFANGTMP